jgi:hypothetical protein
VELQAFAEELCGENRVPEALCVDSDSDSSQALSYKIRLMKEIVLLNLCKDKVTSNT